MTLPVSGNPISLANVNTELGKSYNATISLNDAAVRALAGASSGAISLANLFGKSSYNPGSVTSPTMPTGTYSSVDDISGSYGASVRLVVAANGSWSVIDDYTSTTLASGSWTTAPAAWVGALFNYTLTLTSKTGTGGCDGSSSGTLASGFTLHAGANGSATKSVSITANYSLTITEIKNTANTRTVTFTLYALGHAQTYA